MQAKCPGRPEHGNGLWAAYFAFAGAPPGFALHVHRLRLTGLPATELIRQFLANRGAGTISGQSSDMHEQFRAAMRRRDEAKATIVVP